MSRELQVGWVLLKPLGGGYDPQVMDVVQDKCQFNQKQIMHQDKYGRITGNLIAEHLILPVFVRLPDDLPKTGGGDGR